MRESQDHERGIMTANLGSAYDIPASLRDDSSIAGSTKASTKITSTTAKSFRQTEGATYKPPFQTFFTGEG